MSHNLFKLLTLLLFIFKAYSAHAAPQFPEDCVSIDVTVFKVKEFDGSWAIMNGPRPVWPLKAFPSRQVAQTALDAIRNVEATQLCVFGRPQPFGIYFLNAFDEAVTLADAVGEICSTVALKTLRISKIPSVENRWTIGNESRDFVSRPLYFNHADITLETIKQRDLNTFCEIADENGLPGFSYWKTTLPEGAAPHVLSLETKIEGLGDSKDLYWLPYSMGMSGTKIVATKVKYRNFGRDEINDLTLTLVLDGVKVAQSEPVSLKGGERRELELRADLPISFGKHKVEVLFEAPSLEALGNGRFLANDSEVRLLERPAFSEFEIQGYAGGRVQE